jgi:hypothetical protein
VTGLGRNFLAKKAAQTLGLEKVVDIEELFDAKIAKVSTAVGVGLMTASTIEGRSIEWMQ